MNQPTLFATSSRVIFQICVRRWRITNFLYSRANPLGGTGVYVTPAANTPKLYFAIEWPPQPYTQHTHTQIPRGGTKSSPSSSNGTGIFSRLSLGSN